MSAEDHGASIARLDERDQWMLERFDRIERKVDRLVWTVGGVSATVSMLVTLTLAGLVS